MKTKQILKTLALVVGVAVVSIFFFNLSQSNKIGGYGSPQKTTYDLIGDSISSPASISATSTYSNTSTMYTNNLENVQFDVAFQPAFTDEYLSMLVEVSNDECVTFYPVGVKNVGTTEIDVFTEDASGNVGIPFIIPGDKTSVSSTQYLASFQLDAIADCVRVRVKDNSVTSTGSVYVRGSVSSN